MKIGRGVDASGEISAFTEVGDGKLVRLDGDVESGFTPTTESFAPVRWLPPVEPPVIFGIGLNYRRHAAETGKPLPERPMVFMKNPAAAIGNEESIRLPKTATSTQVDFEAELAVVIGQRCRNVSEDRALEVVAGYTCANDVSARDWQFQWGSGQFCRAKSFDTFCPLGPWLVTTEAVEDPGNLRIQGRLARPKLQSNPGRAIGELVQDSTTADLVFSIPTLISFLSQDTTLLPGTVILTGTPEGVGQARDPQVFLEPNDCYTVTIEGLGTLTNRVN